MSSPRTLRCAGCTQALGSDGFDVAGYRYLVCTACGTARLSEVPPNVEALYGEGYFNGAVQGGYVDYDADARVHARNAAARLRRVDGAGDRVTKLVDVGAGTGYVLSTAKREGIRAIGVDVSPWARRVADGRGLQVVATFEEAVASLPQPDAVRFFQSLEHLVDPDAAIAAAAAALSPGGTLAIETWDRSSRTARLFGSAWQQANPPSVLHLFTSSGIERLLDRHDLVGVTVARSPKWISVGWAAGIAADRWKLARPAVKAVRLLHVDRMMVPYPLDDLVTAYARKPSG